MALQILLDTATDYVDTSADIITGDKTVLSYILSPISRAMKTAFAER